MADRAGTAHTLRARNPGAVVVAGAFTTAGASAPSVIRGEGFTVSAPSTGTYTITLEHKAYLKPIVTCSLSDATANANDTVRSSAESAGSGATAASFNLITASSAGTDANLTGPVVSFIAVLVLSEAR